MNHITESNITNNKAASVRDRSAAHSYDVQISRGYRYVSVDANTRAQAAAIASRAGYTVHSVNMVG